MAASPPTPPSPWLHRYAIFLALATLILIAAGGVVTSKGVGMSVPDWPNSYGYNMFLFPVSQWVGGIFYEHTHRLIASAVGFFTIILAAWIALKDSRRWLRRLGFFALGLVIVQGLLGGFRVVFDRHGLGDELGIFHATLAQLFFALIVAIVLFTGSWWNSRLPRLCGNRLAQVRRWTLVTAFLVIGQLILGAAMRHQHAGLAIPDFPRAYGKWWPATDASAVEHYNQQRVEVSAHNPITAGQILLQMTHRMLAVIILSVLSATVIAIIRLAPPGSLPRRAASLWLFLILAQVALGAATIWSKKSADIATAHVAVGALTLVTGTTLYLMLARLGRVTGEKGFPSAAQSSYAHSSGEIAIAPKA